VLNRFGDSDGKKPLSDGRGSAGPPAGPDGTERDRPLIPIKGRSQSSKSRRINATVTEPRPSGSGFPKTVKHPEPLALNSWAMRRVMPRLREPAGSRR
jgi:hypothetical protein